MAYHRKHKPRNPDYIDPDVAYLLGMIVARGTFHEEGDIRRLIIQFPYRLDTMPLLPNSNLRNIDRETALRVSLDDIRNRLNQLLDVNLDIQRRKHEVGLKAVFTKNTISWRDLRFLTNYRTNYKEFEIPESLYDEDIDIQKEFVRGIVDTAAEPSYADRDQADRQRIVIQIQFGNWRLPVQLCKLLQENLGVSVSNILWGHPNLRGPSGAPGWAKETRIRIYAQDFEPIGFHFQYKQEVFKEFLEHNRRDGMLPAKPCNPKIKRIRKGGRKPKHRDESAPSLPPEIRGRHFNAYFKLCQALGCKQGKCIRQPKIFDTGDED